MNWLTKISLRTVLAQLGAFRSALLMVAVVAISVFCGYRFGNFYHGYQQQTIAQQKQRLDFLYETQMTQVKRINTLGVELEVEKLANQQAMQSLKEMEAKHYQVKKELAFYEKVMAPEKQADGLVIDALSVEKTGSDLHFNFQVVLVQQLLKKRFAKGHIEMSVLGSLLGKPTRYKIGEISSLDKKALQFSFQYFQVVEGDFTLPEGFTPESITVAAVLPKGRWQKYQRVEENVSWQELVQKGVKAEQ